MTRKDNLSAVTKDLGLTPVKGMLRTYLGQYPAMELDRERLIAVIVSFRPSPRTMGRYYWNITVNGVPMKHGSGLPGDVGEEISAARLMYEMRNP